MDKSTKILMVEDLASDAQLIERELRKATVPFVSKRVESREAFLKALTDFQPDLVLSDYTLPQFSGLEALRLLKKTSQDVPFILITGSLTEEVAVKCMKEGAHDYILKTSLKRLPSAVLNALAKRKMEDEKSRAEAALQRSEELHRLIAENTSDLICLIDMSANYVYVSPVSQELLGYAPAELVGQNFYDLIHPGDQAEARRKCVEALIGKKPEQVELRLKQRDGNWRVFETVGNWVYDAQGRAQQGILVSRDLTERKQAEVALRNSEEQLRQAQKLDAVGQLAGGVAHDFNNLLTVITGYSDLLLSRLNESDANRSRVEEIKRAADRASSLTRQLLAFSRKQVMQLRLFDLNGLVADMVNMLQRLIGENIELRTALRQEAVNIHADPGQIEQVVMNLVVNARDAMPHGGKITIETAAIEIDETYAIAHAGVESGQYVKLAVSDTGIGMDAATQRHIFEPFFTTKEQGKGTGLGLSTVYGIVKQSGGNICVYSEPGTGTVFKVYLPRVDQTAAESKVATKSAVVPGGNETILIVEDEPQIRRMATEFLMDCGYNVLASSNGVEAIELLEEYKKPIDLILTDVVMPQMSGRELAERVTAVKPETKVLFMSGYTDDAIVRHGVLDSETWFIQKPFAPEMLARKIRQVLNQRYARPVQVEPKKNDVSDFDSSDEEDGEVAWGNNQET